MASSHLTFSSFNSQFLGTTHLPNRAFKPTDRSRAYRAPRTCAKFNLFEIMGGRGLLNGEAGLSQELKKTVVKQDTESSDESQESAENLDGLPEDGFDKELLGLTGGFPGGETGLRSFIEKNPPPKPKPKPTPSVKKMQDATSSAKPKAPDLPLLLPGMIAMVSNPNSPYYMYTGIVQRITDGKAGVLFEGGIWDRLITFRLEELERRAKGPPGKNPQSAILEARVKTNEQPDLSV